MHVADQPLKINSQNTANFNRHVFEMSFPRPFGLRYHEHVVESLGTTLEVCNIDVPAPILYLIHVVSTKTLVVIW